MITKKEGLAENLILHNPVQQKNAPRKKIRIFLQPGFPAFSLESAKKLYL